MLTGSPLDPPRVVTLTGLSAPMLEISPVTAHMFPFIYFLTYRCLSSSRPFKVAKKDSISFVFEINCLKRGCQVLSFLFVFIQIDAFLPGKLRSQLPCRKSLELVKETQGPAPTGLNTTSCLFVMPQQMRTMSGELLSSSCGFSSPVSPGWEFKRAEDLMLS